MNSIRKLYHVLRTNLARLRAARTSHKRAAACAGKKILVICYGNIYRSPFAGVYLSNRLAQYGYEVRSAGVYGISGRASNEQYVSDVASYGVDLSAHRSIAMDRELINWADYVLVMDRHNYHAVTLTSPEASGKILWLGAFDSRSMAVEIEDPYGGSSQLQQVVIDKLIRCSDGLVSEFVKNDK